MIFLFFFFLSSQLLQPTNKIIIIIEKKSVTEKTGPGLQFWKKKTEKKLENRGVMWLKDEEKGFK